MKTSTLLLILAVVLGMSPALAQRYYKWVDEQGTTHFTAEPPRDADYEIVDTSGAVIGSSSAATGRGQQDQAEEPEPIAMPREGEVDPERVAQRCEQARENLFWLRANRRIQVERDDGSMEFIDFEEQQRLIEENEAILAEWCDEGG